MLVYRKNIRKSPCYPCFIVKTLVSRRLSLKTNPIILTSHVCSKKKNSRSFPSKSTQKNPHSPHQIVVVCCPRGQRYAMNSRYFTEPGASVAPAASKRTSRSLLAQGLEAGPGGRGQLAKNKRSNLRLGCCKIKKMVIQADTNEKNGDSSRPQPKKTNDSSTNQGEIGENKGKSLAIKTLQKPKQAFKRSHQVKITSFTKEDKMGHPQRQRIAQNYEPNLAGFFPRLSAILYIGQWLLGWVRDVTL